MDFSTVVPIQFMYTCFVTHLTYALHYLELAASRSTLAFSIDVAEINKLQNQLLFHINSELIRNAPRNLRSYLIPFNSTLYQDIALTVGPILACFTKENPTKLEDLLRFTRVFVGPSVLLDRDLKEERLLNSLEEVEYFQGLHSLHRMLKDLIHKNLKTMIGSPLLDQTLIEDIFLLIEIAIHTLDNKQVEFLVQKAIDDILIKEYSKGALANKGIINIIVYLIKSLQTNPRFSDESYRLKTNLSKKIHSVTFSAWFQNV
jgi:hypothetical protein